MLVSFIIGQLAGTAVIVCAFAAHQLIKMHFGKSGATKQRPQFSVA